MLDEAREAGEGLYHDKLTFRESIAILSKCRPFLLLLLSAGLLHGVFATWGEYSGVRIVGCI
jgi:hypothetical protein